MINITYAILTHNEPYKIIDLMSVLKKWMDDKDEIIIVDDYSDNKEMINLLGNLKNERNVVVDKRKLNNDFGSQKTHLNKLCTKDWIFNIDADEVPSEPLMYNLHSILETNHKDSDAIAVPRVNIVNGITQEDIDKWGWRIDKENWINWPDYQMRLYRNKDSIVWKNRVHEQLFGYKSKSRLPAAKEFALYHIKDIERQRRQNNMYDYIRNEIIKNE